MTHIQIIPITENHIEGFWAAVDSVAREQHYLSFLQGPPLDMSRAFALENIKDNWPHFIALCDKKVVGWCDISSLHRPVFAHCGTLGIGVLKSFRGQGVGKALLDAALSKAKSIGLTRIELTVRENNTLAYDLYEKTGFVKEGLHQKAVCIDGQYENLVSMALLFE